LAERAAIREHDGEQARPAATTLAEAAARHGATGEAMRAVWARDPDAQALLAYLRAHGPATVAEVAAVLGWPGPRV
jgi:hypothetical protein